MITARKTKYIAISKCYHFRTMRKQLLTDALSVILAGLIVSGLIVAICHILL